MANTLKKFQTVKAAENVKNNIAALNGAKTLKAAATIADTITKNVATVLLAGKELTKLARFGVLLSQDKLSAFAGGVNVKATDTYVSVRNRVNKNKVKAEELLRIEKAKRQYEDELRIEEAKRLEKRLAAYRRSVKISTKTKGWRVFPRPIIEKSKSNFSLNLAVLLRTALFARAVKFNRQNLQPVGAEVVAQVDIDAISMHVSAVLLGLATVEITVATLTDANGTATQNADSSWTIVISDKLTKVQAAYVLVHELLHVLNPSAQEAEIINKTNEALEARVYQKLFCALAYGAFDETQMKGDLTIMLNAPKVTNEAIEHIQLRGLANVIRSHVPVSAKPTALQVTEKGTSLTVSYGTRSTTVNLPAVDNFGYATVTGTTKWKYAAVTTSNAGMYDFDGKTVVVVNPLLVVELDKLTHADAMLHAAVKVHVSNGYKTRVLASAKTYTWVDILALAIVNHVVFGVSEDPMDAFRKFYGDSTLATNADGTNAVEVTQKKVVILDDYNFGVIGFDRFNRAGALPYQVTGNTPENFEAGNVNYVSFDTVVSGGRLVNRAKTWPTLSFTGAHKSVVGMKQVVQAVLARDTYGKMFGIDFIDAAAYFGMTRANTDATVTAVTEVDGVYTVETTTGSYTCEQLIAVNGSSLEATPTVAVGSEVIASQALFMVSTALQITPKVMLRIVTSVDEDAVRVRKAYAESVVITAYQNVDLSGNFTGTDYSELLGASVNLLTGGEILGLAYETCALRQDATMSIVKVNTKAVQGVVTPSINVTVKIVSNLQVGDKFGSLTGNKGTEIDDICDNDDLFAYANADGTIGYADMIISTASITTRGTVGMEGLSRIGMLLDLSATLKEELISTGLVPACLVSDLRSGKVTDLKRDEAEWFNLVYDSAELLSWLDANAGTVNNGHTPLFTDDTTSNVVVGHQPIMVLKYSVDKQTGIKVPSYCSDSHFVTGDKKTAASLVTALKTLNCEGIINELNIRKDADLLRKFLNQKGSFNPSVSKFVGKKAMAVKLFEILETVLTHGCSEPKTFNFSSKLGTAKDLVEAGLVHLVNLPVTTTELLTSSEVTFLADGRVEAGKQLFRRAVLNSFSKIDTVLGKLNAFRIMQAVLTDLGDKPISANIDTVVQIIVDIANSKTAVAVVEKAQARLQQQFSNRLVTDEEVAEFSGFTALAEALKVATFNASAAYAQSIKGKLGEDSTNRVQAVVHKGMPKNVLNGVEISTVSDFVNLTEMEGISKITLAAAIPNLNNLIGQTSFWADYGKGVGYAMANVSGTTDSILMLPKVLLEDKMSADFQTVFTQDVRKGYVALLEAVELFNHVFQACECDWDNPFVKYSFETLAVAYVNLCHNGLLGKKLDDDVNLITASKHDVVNSAVVGGNIDHVFRSTIILDDSIPLDHIRLGVRGAASGFSIQIARMLDMTPELGLTSYEFYKWLQFGHRDATVHSDIYYLVKDLVIACIKAEQRVLFERAPLLWSKGLLAPLVQLRENETPTTENFAIGFHISHAKPANADYDGDAAFIYCFPSIEAQHDLASKLSAAAQCINPVTGDCTYKPVLAAMLGLLWLETDACDMPEARADVLAIIGGDKISMGTINEALFKIGLIDGNACVQACDTLYHIGAAVTKRQSFGASVTELVRFGNIVAKDLGVDGIKGLKALVMDENNGKACYTQVKSALAAVIDSEAKRGCATALWFNGTVKGKPEQALDLLIGKWHDDVYVGGPITGISESDKTFLYGTYVDKTWLSKHNTGAVGAFANSFRHLADVLVVADETTGFVWSDEHGSLVCGLTHARTLYATIQVGQNIGKLLMEVLIEKFCQEVISTAKNKNSNSDAGDRTALVKDLVEDPNLCAMDVATATVHVGEGLRSLFPELACIGNMSYWHALGFMLVSGKNQGELAAPASVNVNYRRGKLTALANTNGSMLLSLLNHKGENHSGFYGTFFNGGIELNDEYKGLKQPKYAMRKVAGIIVPKKSDSLVGSFVAAEIILSPVSGTVFEDSDKMKASGKKGKSVLNGSTLYEFTGVYHQADSLVKLSRDVSHNKQWLVFEVTSDILYHSDSDGYKKTISIAKPNNQYADIDLSDKDKAKSSFEKLMGKSGVKVEAKHRLKTSVQNAYISFSGAKVVNNQFSFKKVCFSVGSSDRQDVNVGDSISINFLALTSMPKALVGRNKIDVDVISEFISNIRNAYLQATMLGVLATNKVRTARGFSFNAYKHSLLLRKPYEAYKSNKPVLFAEGYNSMADGLAIAVQAKGLPYEYIGGNFSEYATKVILSVAGGDVPYMFRTLEESKVNALFGCTETKSNSRYPGRSSLVGFTLAANADKMSSGSSAAVVKAVTELVPALSVLVNNVCLDSDRVLDVCKNLKVLRTRMSDTFATEGYSRIYSDNATYIRVIEAPVVYPTTKVLNGTTSILSTAMQVAKDALRNTLASDEFINAYKAAYKASYIPHLKSKELELILADLANLGTYSTIMDLAVNGDTCASIALLNRTVYVMGKGLVSVKELTLADRADVEAAITMNLNHALSNGKDVVKRDVNRLLSEAVIQAFDTEVNGTHSVPTDARTVELLESLITVIDSLSSTIVYNGGIEAFTNAKFDNSCDDIEIIGSNAIERAVKRVKFGAVNKLLGLKALSDSPVQVKGLNCLCMIGESVLVENGIDLLIATIPNLRLSYFYNASMLDSAQNGVKVSSYKKLPDALYTRQCVPAVEKVIYDLETRGKVVTFSGIGASESLICNSASVKAIARTVFCTLNDDIYSDVIIGGAEGADEIALRVVQAVFPWIQTHVAYVGDKNLNKTCKMSVAGARCYVVEQLVTTFDADYFYQLVNDILGIDSAYLPTIKVGGDERSGLSWSLVEGIITIYKGTTPLYWFKNRVQGLRALAGAFYTQSLSLHHAEPELPNCADTQPWPPIYTTFVDCQGATPSVKDMYMLDHAHAYVPLSFGSKGTDAQTTRALQLRKCFVVNEEHQLVPAVTSEKAYAVELGAVAVTLHTNRVRTTDSGNITSDSITRTAEKRLNVNVGDSVVVGKTTFIVKSVNSFIELEGILGGMAYKAVLQTKLITSLMRLTTIPGATQAGVKYLKDLSSDATFNAVIRRCAFKVGQQVTVTTDDKSAVVRYATVSRITPVMDKNRQITSIKIVTDDMELIMGDTKVFSTTVSAADANISMRRNKRQEYVDALISTVLRQFQLTFNLPGGISLSDSAKSCFEFVKQTYSNTKVHIQGYRQVQCTLDSTGNWYRLGTSDVMLDAGIPGLSGEIVAYQRNYNNRVIIDATRVKFITDDAGVLTTITRK